MNPIEAGDPQFIGLINEDTQMPHCFPLISFLHFSRTVSHFSQVLTAAASRNHTAYRAGVMGCHFTGENKIQSF